MAHETANESLLLATLRHQVGLQRLAGSVREKVFALLDATEADLEKAIITSRLQGGGLRTGDVVRLELLLVQIKGIRGLAWEEIRNLIRSEMFAMTKAEPAFMAAAATASSPVLIDFDLPSPTLLATLVTQHPLDGRTLGSWLNDMERADVDRIMAQVRIGMVQGESIPAIVRRVIGSRALNGTDALATALTRRGTAAVIRTMVNGLSNAAKGEFYKANQSVIAAEVWMATLDGRICPVCMGLDGQRFKVGEGRRPPAHVGCRCVRVAVLASDVLGNRPMKPVTERGLLREFSKLEGLQAPTKRVNLPRGFKGKFDIFSRRRVRELTGTTPARMTYAEFLRKQSVEFQNDVLGKTKARLFRTGKIGIRRFTDRRDDTLTLSELAKKEKAAFLAAGLDPGDFI